MGKTSYQLVQDFSHQQYVALSDFFCGFLLILSTWNDFWITLRLDWMGFEYQHQLPWHGGCAIHRGEWCSSVWLNMGCGKFWWLWSFSICGNHIQDSCEWWFLKCTTSNESSFLCIYALAIPFIFVKPINLTKMEHDMKTRQSETNNAFVMLRHLLRVPPLRWMVSWSRCCVFPHLSGEGC